MSSLETLVVEPVAWDRLEQSPEARCLMEALVWVLGLVLAVVASVMVLEVL